MLTKLVPIVILGLITTIPLYAADIEVKVMSKNKPLVDASVALVELKKSELTDEAGKAVFTDIPTGQYTLITFQQGFEKKTLSITVGTETFRQTIELKALSYTLGEITVRSKRNKGLVTAQTTIRKEDLKSTSQSMMNDAVKTVQAMPGVSTSGSSFDSRMYIQGGNFTEWVASYDNVFIPHPFRWGGRISMFNPLVLDNIDLYNAGYPAAYGQGLSAVLDVKTRNGSSTKWTGFFDQSAASMEAMAEGPLSKNLTLLVNIRRTFYDFIAPLFIPESDRGVVQFPYLWDGTIKLNYTLTPEDSLSFMAYGALEGMYWKMSGDPNGGENAGNLGGYFTYQDINLIASLQYKHRLNEKDSFDVMSAVVPRLGTSKLDQDSTMRMTTTNSEVNYEGAANYYLNSLAHHKAQAGFFVLSSFPDATLDISQYSIDQQGNWTNSLNIKREYKQVNFNYNGIYVLDNWEILPSLILQGGIRAEYFHNTKDWQLNPQGGIKIEATKDLDFFIRTGTYCAYQFNILNADKDYGNPNLKSEKAIHAITGLDYANSEWAFRLEGFYKKYSDLVEDDLVLHYNNNGLREVYGGDVYLQKKAGTDDWFSGWISYTYVTGFEKITARSAETPETPYSSPLDQWFVPDYIRNHTLSTVAELTYRENQATPYLNFMNKWSLALDFRVLSGKPYTPVTNFIAYTTPVGTQYLLQKGAFNSEWTPWTAKLDLKLTLQGSLFSLLELFGMKVESSSYISLINVLNTENVTEYSYQVKNNELQKIPVKDFPFMILGGMRVEF